MLEEQKTPTISPDQETKKIPEPETETMEADTEAEQDLESLAEQTIETIEKDTNQTIAKIKNLANKTIEQIKKTLQNESPEKKEGLDYKKTAGLYLQKIMEMGFPEEGEPITEDILRGSLDDKIARIVQVGSIVAEKIPPINLENLEQELKEVPADQSKAKFLLKKAGGALSEAGIDAWLENKLVQEGQTQTKAIITDNIYLKMTAVAAKKLLNLYNSADQVLKQEVDPNINQYKETSTYKKIINKGLPILKKIIDGAITPEDEKAAEEFLGAKAKQLISQVL